MMDLGTRVFGQNVHAHPHPQLMYSYPLHDPPTRECEETVFSVQTTKKQTNNVVDYTCRAANL